MPDEWTLDLDSEEKFRDCLAELDDEEERRVREFLAGVLKNPLNRQPDREDMWSAQVSRTNTTLVWTLDVDKKVVVLLMCGPA